MTTLIDIESVYYGHSYGIYLSANLAKPQPTAQEQATKFITAATVDLYGILSSSSIRSIDSVICTDPEFLRR